jgi:hypothetical protein
MRQAAPVAGSIVKRGAGNRRPLKRIVVFSGYWPLFINRKNPAPGDGRRLVGTAADFEVEPSMT